MMRTSANQTGGRPERRPSGEAAKGGLIKGLPFPDVSDSRRSGRPNFRLAAVFLVFLGAVFLSACASVKPWERETLSRPGMQLNPEPMILGCDEHIYFSREASKGGQSYGGGGCGCN